MEENWIESTVSLMDAVRYEIERIRWLLASWQDLLEIHDGNPSKFLEPGVYEEMKDVCESLTGKLDLLLADLKDI